MKSEVYFIKLKGSDAKERLAALARLLEVVAHLLNYKKDELIPVKLTIGDSQCIYHISPDIVKVIIAELKRKKTRPFLFDTNVIYKGERTNAVDHLALANNKGFGHSRLGAPFIIADGLLGQDGKEYEVKSGYIKKVKLPSFVGMLDSLVVLSHVTGHILAGYAGAIKNVAMGMVCKPTKQVQHSSIKPHIKKEECTACGCCIVVCPVAAIIWKGKKAFIEERLCIGCGECVCACKFDAVVVNWKEDALIFNKRMVDTADLVLSKFKNKLFINFAFDVTKECDCISTKDEKILTKDAGILASIDAVSIDKASSDFANMPQSHKLLEYAAEKGLGHLEYELKEV